MSLSIEEELRLSRLLLQYEIREALGCRTKKAKLALVAKWRGKYPAVFVEELLGVARDKEVAGKILAWDLDKFRGCRGL
jgi:hypothetical protein